MRRQVKRIFMEQDTSTSQTSSKKSKFPSAFDLLSPSIKALGNNFWTFAGLVVLEMFFIVLFYIVMLANSNPDGTYNSNMSGSVAALLGLGGLLGAICGLIAEPALVKTQLASIEGRKITFSEAIKAGLPFIWRNLGVKVMMGLIYTVSLLLFIVPFFFMLPRYILAPYYVIDRNMGVFDALKASAAEYKKVGGVWGLLGVQLLFGIIPLANWILNILYYCAPALRYRQISKAAKAAPDETAAV